MALARHGVEPPVPEGPAPDFGERGVIESGRRRLAEKAQRRAQCRSRRVFVDGAGEGLLRQLFARGVGGDRQVGVGRLRHAEQTLQMDLAGGRVEQVGAAHGVGDARFGVVHHHGQLVGEQAVGAQHHVVAGVEREILLLPALDCVVEADHALGPHPPCACNAPGRQAVAAGAGVAPRTVAGERRIRHLAPRTGAGKGVAGRFQLLQRGAVGIVAAALPDDLAIPFEAEARQRGDDAFGRAGHGARRIDVLDPQQPAPAVAARFQIAARRCDQRAEMQRAAGRGREAADMGGRRRSEVESVHGEVGRMQAGGLPRHRGCPQGIFLDSAALAAVGFGTGRAACAGPML